MFLISVSCINEASILKDVFIYRLHCSEFFNGLVDMPHFPKKKFFWFNIHRMYRSKSVS